MVLREAGVRHRSASAEQRRRDGALSGSLGLHKGLFCGPLVRNPAGRWSPMLICRPAFCLGDVGEEEEWEGVVRSERQPGENFRERRGKKIYIYTHTLGPG